MTFVRSLFRLRASNSDERWWQASIIFATTLLALLAFQGAPSVPSVAKTNMPIILKQGDVEVHILQIGAVIQKLIIPDRSGKLADVVLGFDEEEPYRDGTSPYFGAIVGRVANRIANASFTLGGRTYKLAANNGPNCLHGGIIGFSRVDWKIEEQGDNEHGQFVKLTYVSPDGDEVRE